MLERVSVDGVFGPVDLAVHEQRIGIVGPNGAGKSTLLDVMVGERRPSTGRACRAVDRIAYVSQNSLNWCRDDSLVEALAEPLGEAVRILRAHRFPFALADRPLRELSPGERLRAALICAFQDAPSLVVLDEPTDHLDFTGVIALERVLRAWSGGLVVVSHDDDFLRAIDVREWITLDPPG
jgi:ATPase subunit of ABC transporter with duplicated ATPase domains